jgi:H+-translocating NAD(P) transhydrogenase subunit alpha
MIVGVPKETYPGETLVALLPAHVPLLTKIGLGVMVESGAGEAAGCADAAYRANGADITTDRAALFGAAGIILQVRTPGANLDQGDADLRLLGPHSTLIGLADPLGRPEAVRELAQRGARLYALELMPRISRAQSMDVLSSLATIMGYKAVLLAADRLPKLFPMLTTPAGTIPPARVLVIGAGVAGLQAIATARRLGAAVSAYDVRPAAKEQIRSLGAKVVAVPADAMEVAEESGGYAKALDEEMYRRQREGLAPTVATSDVIVTTAAVPGRRAPLLMTSDMVARMARGSIIVDVAAGSGGNCELTRPDEAVWHHGVLVLGPTNLPSTVPMHASQLYGRNVANLLLHLCKDGGLRLDLDDDIVRGILVAQGGEVVHPRVRALLDATPQQVSTKG